MKVLTISVHDSVFIFSVRLFAKLNFNVTRILTWGSPARTTSSSSMVLEKLERTFAHSFRRRPNATLSILFDTGMMWKRSSFA